MSALPQPAAHDVLLAELVATAKAAGHPWPAYAACEAVEESEWCSSWCATHARNLFGQKAPQAPPPGWNYPTIDLPTWEVQDGKRVVVAHQAWPVFPDWATSFRERLALLRRVAVPHYEHALAASSGEAFVRLMGPCPDPQRCQFTNAPCETWATDPQRAANVLAIYAEHETLLAKEATKETQ